MTGRFLILAGVIVAFGALTTLALMDVGYWGIIESHFRTWGGAQVLTDLTILAILGCVWMLQDSRQSGLPAWPFILITLVAGSFGVLLYLATRELRSTSQRTAVGRVAVRG